MITILNSLLTMKLQKNRIAVCFAFIVGMLVAFSPLQAQLLSGEIEIGGYDFPTTGNEGFVPNSVHENVSMDYIAKHANISTFYMDASVRPDGTHWLISGSATGATSAALAVET